VFDLFRHPRFTLLASPGDGAAGQTGVIGKLFKELDDRFPGMVTGRLISRDRTDGFDIDSNVTDATGQFAQRYEVGDDGRLVLVRPDMYVGLNAALCDAGKLGDYLAQWCRVAVAP
jgi:hypothetical protein